MQKPLGQYSISVNIEIMRIFERVRALATTHDALRKRMTPPEPPERPIGFVTPEGKGKIPTAAKLNT